MRPIKFRALTELDGKRYLGSKWIYGDLVKFTFSNGETHYYIHDDGLNSPIVPETIGEFTGLHDKNDKEVYEGDIICFKKPVYEVDPYDGLLNTIDIETYKGFVCFMNGQFIVETKHRLKGRFKQPLYDHKYACLGNGEITVIGNIHYNPELLEEK